MIPTAVMPEDRCPLDTVVEQSVKTGPVTSES